MRRCSRASSAQTVIVRVVEVQHRRAGSIGTGATRLPGGNQLFAALQSAALAAEACLEYRLHIGHACDQYIQLSKPCFGRCAPASGRPGANREAAQERSGLAHREASVPGKENYPNPTEDLLRVPASLRQARRSRKQPRLFPVLMPPPLLFLFLPHRRDRRCSAEPARAKTRSRARRSDTWTRSGYSEPHMPHPLLSLRQRRGTAIQTG